MFHESEIAETTSTVENLTGRAPRSLTEWFDRQSECISSRARVTHQRIEARRKSDGVTPVAFLNAVLKC